MFSHVSDVLDRVHGRDRQPVERPAAVTASLSTGPAAGPALLLWAVRAGPIPPLRPRTVGGREGRHQKRTKQQHSSAERATGRKWRRRMYDANGVSVMVAARNGVRCRHSVADVERTVLSAHDY